jgi:hypothetical protein
MTEQTTDLRELHAHLHTKCLELSARVSAMIDHAAQGEDTTFLAAMVGQSLSAVEFWTDTILKMAANEAGNSHG